MPRACAFAALAMVCLGSGLFAGEDLDAAHLERLVLQDCGSCHGLTRKGGLGSDLRSESLSHWDVASLTNVILDGIPGTAMPPWRPIMTETEARWIAEYLLNTE